MIASAVIKPIQDLVASRSCTLETRSIQVLFSGIFIVIGTLTGHTRFVFIPIFNASQDFDTADGAIKNVWAISSIQGLIKTFTFLAFIEICHCDILNNFGGVITFTVGILAFALTVGYRIFEVIRCILVQNFRGTNKTFNSKARSDQR